MKTGGRCRRSPASSFKRAIITPARAHGQFISIFVNPDRGPRRAGRDDGRGAYPAPRPRGRPRGVKTRGQPRPAAGPLPRPAPRLAAAVEVFGGRQRFKTMSTGEAKEDEMYCPICGHKKQLDLATAGTADVTHCGRVMRLAEDEAPKKS